MSFCRNCGHLLDAEDLFCGECGTPIGKQMTEEIEVEEKELDNQEAAALESEHSPEEINGLETEEEVAAQEVEIPGETASVEDVQEEAAEEVASVVEPLSVESECVVVEKQKKKIKPVPVVIIALLVVLIGMFGGTIIYLNTSTFDVPRSRIDVKEYTADNREELVSVDGTKIELEVPQELINAFLKENVEVIADQIGGSISLEGAYMDVREERLYMNTKAFGINVPISMQLIGTIDDEGMRVDINKVKLGKKGLGVPGFLVKGMLGSSSIEVPIETILPELIKITGVNTKKDSYFIKAEVSEESLKKEIEHLKSYANSDVLEVYGVNQDTDQTLVHQLLTKELDSTQAGRFIDRLWMGNVIEPFLIALNDEGAKLFKEKYDDYFEIPEIEALNLSVRRSELLKQSVIDKSSEVFSAIQSYLYGDYYVDYAISQGFLYDKEARREVTIDLLKEQGYLDSSMTLFDKSYILLEDYYNGITLAYVGEGSSFMIDEYGDSWEIPEKDIQVLEEALNREVYFVNREHPDRSQLLQAIKQYTYNQDELYVRYAKSDGKYAHVIISPAGDMNSIYTYVLEKNDNGWQVITSFNQYEYVQGYISYYWCNVNLKILPEFEIPEYDIPYLWEDDFMYLQEVIADRTGTDAGGIEFASMANGWVYIHLVDGRKFVYNAYSDILNQVQNYAEIEALMADEYMPPMFIFLQE